MTDRSFAENRMRQARELFFRYHGNRFYMDHDGVGQEYESFRVPPETEEQWTEEFFSCFLRTKPAGKEARRLYAAATDMVRRDKHREAWDRLLEYPLVSGHLDDVTRLYMLSDSFRMAQRAAKAHLFSRAECRAYLGILEPCIRKIASRAGDGTLTRGGDYSPLEFSDPAYTAGYLEDLRKRWETLMN